MKPKLIYHSENPRALKNYAVSILPVLCKWNNKAWVTAHLLTTWFTDFLSPLLRPTAQEKKKISFKILLLIHNAPGHPGALMEMDNELNVLISGKAARSYPLVHSVQAKHTNSADWVPGPILPFPSHVLLVRGHASSHLSFLL